MGKQVPFVIYMRGVRTVIGMAIVQEDGEIEAVVNNDHWPIVKNLLSREALSFTPNCELAILPSIHAPQVASATTETVKLKGNLGESLADFLNRQSKSKEQ